MRGAGIILLTLLAAPAAAQNATYEIVPTPWETSVYLPADSIHLLGTEGEYFLLPLPFEMRWFDTVVPAGTAFLVGANGTIGLGPGAQISVFEDNFVLGAGSDIVYYYHAPSASLSIGWRWVRQTHEGGERASFAARLWANGNIEVSVEDLPTSAPTSGWVGLKGTQNVFLACSPQCQREHFSGFSHLTFIWRDDNLPNYRLTATSTLSQFDCLSGGHPLELIVQNTGALPTTPAHIVGHSSSQRPPWLFRSRQRVQLNLYPGPNRLFPPFVGVPALAPGESYPVTAWFCEQDRGPRHFWVEVSPTAGPVQESDLSDNLIYVGYGPTGTSTITTPAIIIASPQLPPAVLGWPYRAALSASNASTWSVMDPPFGPSADFVLTPWGELVGTPQTLKTVRFWAKADAVFPGRTYGLSEVSIEVQPPPPLVIKTTSLPSGEEGRMYLQPVLYEGGRPPYQLTLEDAPAWLTITQEGVLSGLPNQPGHVRLTAVVQDGGGDFARQSLTLRIDPRQRLKIVSTDLPDGQVDRIYRMVLSAENGQAPYTWSLYAGDLPPGIELDPLGILYGTPEQPGDYLFEIEVGDWARDYLVAPINLRILPAEDPLSASLPPQLLLTVGEPYLLALNAQGGVPPYRWRSDPLPEGLILESGELSGTPRNPLPGAFIRFWVSDQTGQQFLLSTEMVIQAATTPSTKPEPSGCRAGPSGLWTLFFFLRRKRKKPFLKSAENPEVAEEGRKILSI